MKKFKDRQKDLQNFAHENKDLLVIIGDPATDSLFMAYEDKMVLSKIKSADGRNTKVIKQALRWSSFAGAIDNLIVALSDMMSLPIKKGNQFFQWIDGAIYGIVNKLSIKKKKK